MTRDEKGRFIKGNPGGGRLKRSTEEKYLAILRETITPEDWQDICIRAIQDAKRGDAAARKWCADYLIGPPIERKEITGAGGGPVKLHWDDGENIE